MRISLWRQFSGNHSSSFTLVGLFESPAAAEASADKLRTMLEEIAAWKESNPNYGWDLDRDVTPPEQELAQQYGLEWDYSLDWLTAPQDIGTLVSVVDRLVFISATDEYAQSGAPVDQIIQQLGGSAYLDVEDDYHREVVADLTCSAPDEELAAAVVAAAQADFEGWQEGMEEELGSLALDQPGRAERDGRTIRIEGYPLNALEALLGDLIEKGCGQLSYQLREQPLATSGDEEDEGEDEDEDEE